MQRSLEWPICTPSPYLLVSKLDPQDVSSIWLCCPQVSMIISRAAGNGPGTGRALGIAMRVGLPFHIPGINEVQVFVTYLAWRLCLQDCWLASAWIRLEGALPCLGVLLSRTRRSLQCDRQLRPCSAGMSPRSTSFQRFCVETAELDS